MSGLTDTGYTAKTLEEILADIEEAELAVIHSELSVAPTEPIGQINGIMAAELADLHELVAVAFTAFDDSKAEGYLLNSLCYLTGTQPKKAAPGVATLSCTLTSGTTLTGGVATANVTGDSDNRWVLVSSFTAPSTGTFPLVFNASTTGPIAAVAGTIQVITTPVAGWSAVTNPLDAEPGNDVEAPDVLRARRRAELPGSGSSTAQAIQVDLADVPGVIQAFVFENTSMTTNGDGLPAKSLECVVWDGVTPAASDADIGLVIWSNKPGGIELYGASSVSVTDSTGVAQTVKFTRVTVRPVYVSVDVTGTGISAADVKAALVAKGAAALTVGASVVELALRAAPLAVAGVTDVPACRLGFTSSPSGTTNLTVGTREIAVLDTSRITVNFV